MNAKLRVKITPQNVILNSNVHPKVSKDTKNVRLDFREMCIKPSRIFPIDVMVQH